MATLSLRRQPAGDAGDLCVRQDPLGESTPPSHSAALSVTVYWLVMKVRRVLSTLLSTVPSHCAVTVLRGACRVCVRVLVPQD